MQKASVALANPGQGNAALADSELDEALKRAHLLTKQVFEQVAKSVIGQQALHRSLLSAVLAEGHVLLEGVPGLAKTLSIKSLASCIDASFKRVQFTPDLLPSDIIGTEVYRPQDAHFEIRKGPIFANFVLTDEINRAPAKVQSALLETMEERQVTIGGETLALPRPFFVMATQNPLEQEGTYPLAEAQLDRFLMKVKVEYPSRDEEKQMLDLIQTQTSKAELDETNQRLSKPLSKPCLTLAELRELIALCGRIYVDDRLKTYIVNLVNASRKPKEFGLNLAPLIELGGSPRASIALLKLARAEALLSGETYVGPHIIKKLAPAVLRHRLLLSFEAESQGVSVEEIIKSLLDGVPVP